MNENRTDRTPPTSSPQLNSLSIFPQDFLHVLQFAGENQQEKKSTKRGFEIVVISIVDSLSMFGNCTNGTVLNTELLLSWT